MSGAPGKYYIKAEIRQQNAAAPEVRSDGTQPAVYGTTWYPASESKDRATAVEAAAGGLHLPEDLRDVAVKILKCLDLPTRAPPQAPAVSDHIAHA